MKGCCKAMFSAAKDAVLYKFELYTAKRWGPLMLIHNYALFMAYLSLAIKGLGYLVLMWTTVVLLGGFVSMLNQKDFWSLTLITLIQTVGVLDASANESLTNFGESLLGLLVWTLSSSANVVVKAKALAGLFAAVIQTLVTVLVLFPLGATHMFGKYISTGLSIWRLIQQDYIDVLDTDPSKKNLRPALNVIYFMSLLQGGLFLYRAIFCTTKGKDVVNCIAKEYRLEDQTVIADYFRETRVGVEKDLSFARQWHPLKYVMGLLLDTSSETYCSAVRFLSAILQNMFYAFGDDWIKGGVAPESSYETERLVRKLFLTLDPSERYGSKAREDAASILEILADGISLEQFPQGLPSIRSLLLKDRKPGLMLKGMSILMALAAREENRKAIGDMSSLFPEILATVNMVLGRHRNIGNNEDEEHRTWEDEAQAALRLILSPVLPTLGGSMVIEPSTMENIIQCDMCQEFIKEIMKDKLKDPKLSRLSDTTTSDIQLPSQDVV